MEVKNKKKLYKPFQKIGKSRCIVRWDYTPIMVQNSRGETVESQIAKWQEQSFDYMPTIDEIRDLIFAYYNQQTDKKILSGFTWKGMQIWLSQENQFNYKAFYDFAVQTNGSNLPITIKTGDNSNISYYTFNTIDEFRNFYAEMLSFIQTTVQDGWTKKDSINFSEYSSEI